MSEETRTGTEVIDLGAADLMGCPFSRYARIREEAALARGVLPGGTPAWLVTRYQDVRTVAADPRFVIDAAQVPGAEVTHRMEAIWRTRGMQDDDARYLRAAVFDTDGPEHRRMRAFAARSFSPRAMQRVRPHLEAIADGHAARLPLHAADGVVDLVPHYTAPVASTAVFHLIGIPEADRERWRERTALVAGGASGAEVGQALHDLVEDAHGLIDRSRETPGSGFISELARAEDEDGNRLTGMEMVALLAHLVVAGRVTVIANGIAAMLAHPEQLAWLRQHPDQMPSAVDELMRWCGPVVRMLPRYATEDLTIGGTLIRKGAAVVPVIAGANRDPRAFADPDRLDITRAPEKQGNSHVALGHGPHRCLGAALARTETEVALAVLLRRFPSITLASAVDTLPRIASPGNWDLATLPVKL
jgi:cytochrome P450